MNPEECGILALKAPLSNKRARVGSMRGGGGAGGSYGVCRAATHLPRALPTHMDAEDDSLGHGRRRSPRRGGGRGKNGERGRGREQGQEENPGLRTEG